MRKFAALVAVIAGLAIPATAQAVEPGAIFSSQQAIPAGADSAGASPRDPIVAPGPAGTVSEHPHIFCGSQGVDSNSTAASMLAAPTAYVEKGIHSGLWEPQAKYNGVPLKLGTTSSGGGKHCLIYYRDNGQAGTAHALPNGLKMVLRAGTLHGHVINFPDELNFKCGPGSSTDLSAPPSTCTSNVLSTSARFPQCWDGKNLDTVQPSGAPAVNPQNGEVYPNDHLSHMAYAPCPSSHPVELIRVEQFFRHWVPNYSNLNPNLFTFGGHPYSEFHTDYLVDWNPNTMADFMARCITPHIACATNINLAE